MKERQLAERINTIEKDNRKLKGILIVQLVMLFLLVGALFSSCTRLEANEQSKVLDTLTVTELVVVDPNGVERVRIGGDLPDAVIDGKTIDRGEDAAGVLLYDDTGQERGGYVTWSPSGNVGLTLDTRKGQATLFVADPEAGSALRLWHGNDSIELRSDGDGSRLTVVESGEIAFQRPAVESVNSDACNAYRGALEKMSQGEVLAACKQRFPVRACLECLGHE